MKTKKTRRDKLKPIFMFLWELIRDILVGIYSIIMVVVVGVILFIIISAILYTIYPFYYLIYNGDLSCYDYRAYVFLNVLKSDKIFDFFYIDIKHKGTN